MAFLALSFLQLGLTTQLSLANTECNDLENYGYEGSCKDGRYHGFGNLSYPDGGYYSGDWRDGERNGNRSMEFSMDDSEGRKSYDGEWSNDVVEGHGRMEWRKDNPYNQSGYEG